MKNAMEGLEPQPVDHEDLMEEIYAVRFLHQEDQTRGNVNLIRPTVLNVVMRQQVVQVGEGLLRKIVPPVHRNALALLGQLSVNGAIPVT